MTKIFLHGGKAGIKSKLNRKFFQNFLEDYIQGDRVLIIPFAKNNNLFTLSDFNNYLHDYLDYDVLGIIASNDARELIQQIKENKFIYICGGDHNNLYDKIIFLKDFLNIFEGKIIAGSSAGVNILSKISFSNDYQSITKGLGLLDIGTMCHFSNKGIGKNMLEENNENGKSFFIKEEEYIYLHSEAGSEYEVKQIKKPEEN